MRVAPKIELDAPAEHTVRRMAAEGEGHVRRRAHAILLAASGLQDKSIAPLAGLDRREVAMWRRRFIEQGPPALLQPPPRMGRRPSVTPDIESRIVELARGDARWSARALASHLGLSATTVRRVWLRQGLRG